jgi:hypothetical protein
MPCLRKNAKNTNVQGMKKISSKDHEKNAYSGYDAIFVQEYHGMCWSMVLLLKNVLYGA